MEKSALNKNHTGGLRTRIPPVESDDSCLSGESTESSGDEDSDSETDAPATSASVAGVAIPKIRLPKIVREVPQEEVDETKEPIQYFQDFFDDDLLDSTVHHSNLYCRQRNPNRALNLDRNELQRYLGTVVYMSVLDMPWSTMYWSSECRVRQVADVMSRDRWKEISKYLYFSNSGDMAASGEDKLFKIRPVVDSLLLKFQALPQDKMLCVDEHIVPFNGRCSLKQYFPAKPFKYGYKIFVLCDTQGLVHSFHIFTGKVDPLPGDPDLGAGGNIVLKLAQAIHGAADHLLYLNNWFSSLDLFTALANKGIPALGSVEENRPQGCSFNFSNVHYRIQVGSNKSHHRLFFHFVDMAIVNSWMLYQRECYSRDVPRKRQKDLLAFRASLAEALSTQGKDASWRKRGRPSSGPEGEFGGKKHRSPTEPVPTLEVRSDGVGHWPAVGSERQRCKRPNCKGQSVFKCSKCNVSLCLKRKNNCFREFHETDSSSGHVDASSKAIL